MEPPKTADTPVDRVDAETATPIWRAGTLVYTSGGIITLFLWLLFGDFAWSMRDRSVSPMAQWYLNQLDVPNLLFALLISSFPAAAALILGPVISVLSDRHRGPRGRRIPFLLLTTPIAAAGMIGLGLTPLISYWVHAYYPSASEAVVSIVCFGVFWAAFELATVASQAVFGGLINDVVPKPLLGRFFGLFRIVSLADGIVFNFWIMGKVPEHFTLILCTVGVFYGLAFMWVCVNVKEGDYPPPDSYSPGNRVEGVSHRISHEIRAYFRQCFANPYYLTVFLMLMLAAAAMAPVNVFTIPYATSLGISMEIYGHYVALTFFVSLCLSYFIGWLCDAFHPLRVVIASLVGYALVTLWGSFFAFTATTFLVAWVGHGILSGCYFTSVASLGQRLYPESRFAQFASAAGIFTGIANMFIAPLVGMLIDASGDFYRLTFFAGFALASLALICAMSVHARFLQLGGVSRYVAPE